jgi:hypothetical protein
VQLVGDVYGRETRDRSIDKKKKEHYASVRVNETLEQYSVDGD